MKEGRSLQALAMELERQRSAKQDFLVHPGSMSLVPAADGGVTPVTRQAQDVASYDRSTELEATGYKIVTMPPSLWRSMTKERV